VQFEQLRQKRLTDTANLKAWEYKSASKASRKNGVEGKYSICNEQFRDTFPWQDFFPDMFQIPWHFQVFHTSGHPVRKILSNLSDFISKQQQISNYTGWPKLYTYQETYKRQMSAKSTAKDPTNIGLVIMWRVFIDIITISIRIHLKWTFTCKNKFQPE